MSKKIKFISVLILIVFLSSGIFAQIRGNARTGHQQMMRTAGYYSPMMLYRVLKNRKQEFKVTDTQLGKIKELAFNWEKDMINYGASNASLRLELKKLLSAENPNYSKIKIFMDKLCAAKTDFFINCLKVKAQVRNILTKDQLDKLTKMRMEMRKKFMRNRFKTKREKKRYSYHR